MKALIISETLLEAKIISDNLENEGYQVVICSRNDDVIRIVRDMPDIKVIIIDEKKEDLLPSEESPTSLIVRSIKSGHQSTEIPIILLTNHSNLEDMEDSSVAGVYYILTKPVERYLLNSVVNSASKTSYAADSW